MPDIIQEAWTSAAECTLLAQETKNREMRRFFLNLASSWKKVALNYEVLAQNDKYLIELRCSREVDATGRPADARRNGHNPVRLKMTLRWTVGYFWRR